MIMKYHIGLLIFLGYHDFVIVQVTWDCGKIFVASCVPSIICSRATNVKISQFRLKVWPIESMRKVKGCLRRVKGDQLQNWVVKYVKTTGTAR